MGILSVELDRAKANGDKKVSGFTGAVRSLEMLTIEEGDTFTMPEKYEVYQQKVGVDANGKDRFVDYIWVSVGKDNVKKFFPSTFTKSRTIYNEDGTPTNERMHTTGSAAEVFQKASTVESGMNALKGKTLKVSKVNTIRTLRYGTTTVVNAQIPVIDFAD